MFLNHYRLFQEGRSGKAVEDVCGYGEPIHQGFELGDLRLFGRILLIHRDFLVHSLEVHRYLLSARILALFDTHESLEDDDLRSIAAVLIVESLDHGVDW